MTAKKSGPESGAGAPRPKQAPKSKPKGQAGKKDQGGKGKGKYSG